MHFCLVAKKNVFAFCVCLYLIISVCLCARVLLFRYSMLQSTRGRPSSVRACKCVCGLSWLGVDLFASVCYWPVGDWNQVTLWHRCDVSVRSPCPPMCHPVLMFRWPSPLLLSTHIKFFFSFFYLMFSPLSLFSSQTLNIPFLSPYFCIFILLCSSYFCDLIFFLPPLWMTQVHFSDKLYPPSLSSPSITKHRRNKRQTELDWPQARSNSLGRHKYFLLWMFIQALAGLDEVTSSV